jgi:D-alanyl-D-alanine carboxypeptidase (penicillin-binding protein 5/6)
VEAGPLSDPVTIETSDTRVEPTKLYLKPGDTYTRDTLLKAILVCSCPGRTRPPRLRAAT